MNSQPVKQMSVEELHNIQDKVIIADIRDSNSFAQGHVPGAINLNNDNIQEFVDTHEFDQPMVVVCYAGHSSLGAASVLMNVGFENISSLTGGMGAWRLQYPDQIEGL